MKEIKRDLEAALVGTTGGAKVAGSDTVARKAGNLKSYLTTDSWQGGATGVAPTGNGLTAATPGTARPFTEALLTAALQKLWTNSGGSENIAGLMGAGRTEVARAIFGADKIDSGEIIVHGQKVSIKTPTDAVKYGIGYLSEDRKHFGLATGMDVESNIVLTTMKRFLSGNFFLKQKAIRETALHFVKQLDIKTPSVSQKVAFLSGGNQQKVVIAKWLVRDCEVLFFDEPTRGIDVGAKSEIYKLLNTLAEQGRAIVMISSELPEVLRLSHRILVMCEGRITGELKAGEATQENIMQYATQRETTQLN